MSERGNAGRGRAAATCSLTNSARPSSQSPNESYTSRLLASRAVKRTSIACDAGVELVEPSSSLAASLILAARWALLSSTVADDIVSCVSKRPARSLSCGVGGACG